VQGSSWKERAKKAGVLFLALVFVLLAYLALLQGLPLREEDGRVLLGIAEAGLQGRSYGSPIPARLNKVRPVFVSVYSNGSRIACVGYTDPPFPLHESVRLLSQGIDIVVPEEHEVVITVFGGYEELKEGMEIPPGNGVLVRRDGYEGVVLPLTFEERNLTDEAALELAAQKAGFQGFSWSDFQVYTFDAKVFRSR